MATVFLSLGTNIDRQRHVGVAIEAFAQRFASVTYSRIYESEAVGFVGDPFYNWVARIDTHYPVAELSAILKQIEDLTERDRSAPKFSGRTLDIDLLTYDQLRGEQAGILLPRAETLTQAFVLCPLAELAPDRIHPGTDQNYRCLWRSYQKRHPKAANALWLIDVECMQLANKPLANKPLANEHPANKSPSIKPSATQRLASKRCSSKRCSSKHKSSAH